MITPTENKLLLGLVVLAVLLTFIFCWVMWKAATQLKSSKPLPAENTADQDKAQPERTKTVSQALQNTQKNIMGRLQSLFSGSVSAEILENIEEVLYTSDLGPTTVTRLMKTVEEGLSQSQKKDFPTVQRALQKEMNQIFDLLPTQTAPLQKASSGPTVLMIVGVNGAGKTTSIGKIAAQLGKSGQKVLVAAGDTFRAAAGEQLKAWTERAQVEIFSPPGVTDPSAVAFDALSKAKAQNFDYVIIDTAGRLHTQSHLMEELKKVKRVLQKIQAEAPHETWIVLDANSGQNALMQAKEFNQALNLTGAILTKMDGTAKGGVALSLACELTLPIKLIGIGEKIEDLKPFSSQEYVQSILGLHEGT